MPKPSLLFLSHLLPYPPDSGAAIRTFNVLRILSEAFDVTALCFARATESAGAGSPRERAAAMAKFGDIRAFPIPSDLNRARLVYDHLRSTVWRQPYVRYIYDSRAYRSSVAEVLAAKPIDLVHVDSLDLAEYLPEVHHLPTVCVHHNVESALLRRRAAAERFPPSRAYLRFQARLLRRQEQHWCERVNLNVVVSDEDRQQFEELAPRARVITIPNGVDIERYRPGPSGNEGLAFVGGTTWFPNRDALSFFAGEVLPLLRLRRECPPIQWVGTASTADRQQFAGVSALTLTGYVEDERPVMRDAACFIVPLRVGGGTRLKILNAWAMGKAVVSTSIGCEGLEASHGENILIADSPADFAKAIDRVLREPELRKRLGAGGRATAERTYSWQVIGQRMIQIYLSLLQPGYATLSSPAPALARW